MGDGGTGRHVQNFTDAFTPGFAHTRSLAYARARLKLPRRKAGEGTQLTRPFEAAQVLGTYARKLTQGFLELKSHYLFDHHFCRVARGNEKGVVEGMVKFARLNFFVPVPEVNSIEELNARLLEQCQHDLRRKLRGKQRRKAELLEEDRNAFLSLPTPFDACRKVSTAANSLSLVHFDTNDYSVPVRRGASYSFSPLFHRET
jgi:hypothetical protein